MTKAIIFVLCLASATIINAFGQQLIHPTNIPGAIDGSRTPDLIPDAMAYRLFFEAIEEPFAASDK